MNTFIRISSLIAFTLSAASLVAAPRSYDFTDAKGVNTISFSLDAPLEAISGTGNGVSGKITFDPSAPEATKGEIVLATESLTVPNPSMRDHLHGSNWLNVAQNPKVIFTADSVEVVETSNGTIKTHVSGTLLLNGVTKDVTVPVTFTHLPGRLGDRSRGQMQGDLLVVRSTFTVKRSDFDIRPGQNLDTVAEEIEISLALAGAAPDA